MIQEYDLQGETERVAMFLRTDQFTAAEQGIAGMLQTTNGKRRMVGMRLKGELDLKKRLVQSASMLLEEALILATIHGEALDEAHCRLLLAESAYSTSNLQSASEYLEQAEKVYLSKEHEVGRIKCMICRGYMLELRGDSLGAIEVYKTAIEAAKATNEVYLQARIHQQMSSAYMDTADFDRSLESLNEAELKYAESGSRIGLGRVHMTRSSVFRRQGDFAGAIAEASSALDLFKSIGADHEAARISHNLGSIYLILENPVDAKQCYQFALEYFTARNMLAEMALATENLGAVAHTCNEFSVAIELYIKANSIYESIGNRPYQADVCQKLGTTFLQLNEYDHARTYLELAIELELGTGRSDASSAAQCSLGKLFAQSDWLHYDPEKAEGLLQESMRYNMEKGQKRNVYLIHENFIKLYKSTGDYEKCIVHFETHQELYREIVNADVKKQADRFEWERKLLEIESQREVQRVKNEEQTASLDRTVTQLVKTNELLSQLSRNTERLLDHVRGEGIKICEQLLDKLSRSIKPISDIHEVDEQLRTVHAPFIQALKSVAPTLSTMEHRVAALLHMKLTSAQIAAVLSVSKRTVEFHRLNIRKKMSLLPEQDLYSVFTSIS